jgi:hypothetical protein
MGPLPQLNHFKISLLGKGVGPAIMIDAAERSKEDNSEYTALKEFSPVPDQLKWTVAMKTFLAVCPYPSNSIVVPLGLEDKGVQPGVVPLPRAIHWWGLLMCAMLCRCSGAGCVNSWPSPR